MRTPQTCSSKSRGPFQEQHTDEGDSAESHETGLCAASSSSFSLQECIDEFRAKKVHRSSQSNQNTDDDLINQNKSNKQNERNSKPCKDGFCYCFTSDSDDFRIYKSDEKKKSRRSETIEEQISDMSNINHKKRRRETFPLNSKKRHETHPRNSSPRKVTAISKLEDSSRSSKAPLIHIIQEIRNNCVVSEVRVNKHKIPRKSPQAKKQMVTEQKIVNVPAEMPINPNSPAYAAGVSEIDSLTEEFQQSSLNTSSRSSDKNGGRLLQKRLSSNLMEYIPRNLTTPPRKPPRNILAANIEQTSISTAPSIREAEKILDDFLRRKGIPVPRVTPPHKRNRKSFPLTKNVNPRAKPLPAYVKPKPSCPSLSDIEDLSSVKTAESCGIIQEREFTWDSPKIREMLNLDVKSKNFQSNHPECGPQVGWTIPPKLDIDTVDGAYHNLAANLESKCTPVKTEMLNNKNESQKFILAEQLKNFVSNSPWTSKKAKDKQNVKKSNSFLSASKTKLLRFVTKKSPPKSRSIGVQAFAQSGLDLEKTQCCGAQSPPGSYFSNTPAKTSKGSQTEFDFSRTVHSPKRDKIPQRKLLFHTRNVLQDPQPRKTNSDKNQNLTYQSYNSGLDNDLTLSKMGQVLNNIRCRLEASDDHAVETFSDIQRKEAAAAVAFSYDCVDGYDYQRVYRVSAQADVHNEREPSYSEIEEDSIFITGSPVTDNTNGIEHFVVESDPKAIYAKINKTPKKYKPHAKPFNNVMEQNSPPKLRNVSKTDLSVQSEIFLENLTSENNASLNRTYEKADKVHNVHQGERSFNEVNNLDDSYVSVESFRESLAKESDAVSYELPNDNTNPINSENVTGNQSTPKKTMHLSKFGMEMMSDDGLEQTTSCPATPGWLLNDELNYGLMEESMSLREELTTTAGGTTQSSLWKYQTLKDKLRKSIRKSRRFLKNEGKRISASINSPKLLNSNQFSEPWDESSLCITNLFSMDDKAPVKDQLTQAVSICRLVPELEISPEMVEAERLLLFSTLKRDAKNLNISNVSQDDEPRGAIVVKSICLPIKENNEQELFFNYYYIGVFSSGSLVKSTQSAECTNGQAIFRNCNISFDNVKSESEIRCDIFMLRLRKISTSRRPPPKVKKLSLESAASDEILSRFRPHASFVICPRDFVPYHLVESCSNASENFFCLHAAKSCKSSIIPQTRSSNLLNEVHVSGEIEQLFRKCSKRGFLNVQDVNKTHNWNLRWCELDSLQLNVWNGPNDVSINKPVYTLDLRKCITLPVECASREVCARSRSFCLTFETNDTPFTHIFSADNQSDLNFWTSALNEILEFIAVWMK